MTDFQKIWIKTNVGQSFHLEFIYFFSNVLLPLCFLGIPLAFNSTDDVKLLGLLDTLIFVLSLVFLALFFVFGFMLIVTGLEAAFILNDINSWQISKSKDNLYTWKYDIAAIAEHRHSWIYIIYSLLTFTFSVYFITYLPNGEHGFAPLCTVGAGIGFLFLSSLFAKYFCRKLVRNLDPIKVAIVEKISYGDKCLKKQ